VSSARAFPIPIAGWKAPKIPHSHNGCRRKQRLAGKGENKHRGIEDVVAAADALVKQNYATRQHIALYSASAGGIIVGGAIDRFPDRFGAAIVHAGMLNPTRLAVDTNGANQYSEFGDPTTERGFKELHAMDAYLNIKDKVAYPAVLLDVGLNDKRVAAWNSGKYGARLRAANTGSKSILFRMDSDSGHFGTSMSQEAAERADDYTFVEMMLNPGRSHADAK
jgi:prolyl oligopeptidase